jgi:hypothetical protein
MSMISSQDFSVRSQLSAKVCESQVSVSVVVISASQAFVGLLSELFLKSRVPFSLLYIKSYNHSMNLLGISQFRGSSIINQCEVVLKLPYENRAIHLRAIKYGREVMFLIREFRCRRAGRFGASAPICEEEAWEVL